MLYFSSETDLLLSPHPHTPPLPCSKLIQQCTKALTVTYNSWYVNVFLLHFLFLFIIQLVIVSLLTMFHKMDRVHWCVVVCPPQYLHAHCTFEAGWRASFVFSSKNSAILSCFLVCSECHQLQIHTLLFLNQIIK